MPSFIFNASIPKKSPGSGTTFLLIAILFAITVFPSAGFADQSLLKAFENEFLNMLESVEKSVVTVTVSHAPDGKNQILPQKLSGFIYGDRYAVVKSVEINETDNLTVQRYDGFEVPATLLGFNPRLGVGVLRIMSEEFSSAKIVKSNDLRAGCWVIVVGNSLGVPNAASLGMVNCVRSDGIIQIAGNVPAASLGSPIFNSDGKLVGLLSALISPEPAEINADPTFVMGDMLLAEPILTVIDAVESIVAEADKPWIGIGADNWPGHMGGAHIRQIIPGSPAEKADLQVGDIIVGIEGKKWSQTQQFADYIKGKEPGDSVRIEILRGDKKYIRSVQIGTRGAHPFSFTAADKPTSSPNRAIQPEENRIFRKEIKKLQLQLDRLKSEHGTK